MTQGTLLCFDFGTKRIGVAVGQTLTCTATALETVAVKNNRPDWGRIARLLDEWRPSALVVGDPLTMDDSRQPVTELADRFCRQLQGRFNLPVYRAEERLTSRESASRSRAKTKRDDLAACLILEGWLQKQDADNVTKDATIART